MTAGCACVCNLRCMHTPSASPKALGLPIPHTRAQHLSHAKSRPPSACLRRTRPPAPLPQVYCAPATSGAGVASRCRAEPIEPLNGFGRHPFAEVGCRLHRSARAPIRSEVDIFNIDHIVLASRCADTTRVHGTASSTPSPLSSMHTGRNWFFDAGCSVYGRATAANADGGALSRRSISMLGDSTGKRPSAFGPSLPLFTQVFARAADPERQSGSRRQSWCGRCPPACSARPPETLCPSILHPCVYAFLCVAFSVCACVLLCVYACVFICLPLYLRLCLCLLSDVSPCFVFSCVPGISAYASCAVCLVHMCLSARLCACLCAYAPVRLCA